MAKSFGFDLIDPGAARPLEASVVFTNAEHQQSLRSEIEAGAANLSPLNAWLQSCDTGISSLTIAEVLSGRTGLAGGRRGIPYDPGDLGRCIRLLEKVPWWRERLPEVAEQHPRWAPFVEHWDELKALYWEELPSGSAPRCYQRMLKLRGVAS